MIKVIFVCMGNICRSPTAHGVFLNQVEAAGCAGWITVDSAGTHAYALDAAPDVRTQVVAMEEQQVDLSSLRSRRLSVHDCVTADYLLVMDAQNEAGVRAVCPEAHHYKIAYLMDFAPQWKVRHVPDPYYGGENGFRDVLYMITDATVGFLRHLQLTHGEANRSQPNSSDHTTT